MKQLPVSGAVLSMLLATMISGSFAAGARPRPQITAAQARQIALKKYPHARVERRAPLENEEGKWQYAVTLRDGAGKAARMHEVMVGAVSGKIEADETTTPREEAREKAAEKKARGAKSHSLKTGNARG